MSFLKSHLIFIIIFAILVLSNNIFAMGKTPFSDLDSQSKFFLDSFKTNSGRTLDTSDWTCKHNFENLISTSPDCVIVTDNNGIIIRINSEVEKVFGWSETELLGKPVETIIPHRFRNEHIKSRLKFAQNPVCRHMKDRNLGNLTGLTKDGTELPLAISLIPLSFGTETIIFSMIRDLTEEKTIENEKRRLELIEKENNLKSLFFSKISHDLKTPLNGIMGGTQISLCSFTDLISSLKKGKNFQEKDLISIIENLQITLSSVQSLNKIFDDIIDLNKIQVDKLILMSEPFLLKETLDSIYKDAKTKAEKKNLIFSWYFSPGLPNQLIGDAKRISQILFSLIDNAIKYTNSGFVRVAIEGKTQQSTLHLKIEVEDTGIGIPMELKDKIGSPLFQVNKSMESGVPGAGLSLNIAKALINLMNGRLEIASKQNIGSLFTVTIQIPLTPDQNSTKQLNKVSNAHENISMNNIRVLIVDDNSFNQLSIQKLFPNSFETILANNGKQAVDVVFDSYDRNLSIQLIIMDKNMPVMNGIDATKEIRKLALKYNYNPIIFLYTSDSEADLKNENSDFSALFNDFLPKPINKANLMQIFAKWQVYL